MSLSEVLESSSLGNIIFGDRQARQTFISAVGDKINNSRETKNSK